MTPPRYIKRLTRGGAGTVFTALARSDPTRTSGAELGAEPGSDPGAAAGKARDTAGVVAPPPLIYLAGLAVGFALEALLPGASLPAAVQWLLGGALVVAGIALLASFNLAFSRKGTAVEPWKPTTAIVTSGPYRVTRNPAYLGMALIYVGIALMSEALWVLVPLPVVLAVIDRGVIAREERYLERKFGSEYLDYKRQVRRWV
jgi:protein-S-isoprenylcysteine O-methyltransferase Ste14